MFIGDLDIVAMETLHGICFHVFLMRLRLIKRASHGKDLAPPGLIIICYSFPEVHGPHFKTKRITCSFPVEASKQISLIIHISCMKALDLTIAHLTVCVLGYSCKLHIGITIILMALFVVTFLHIESILAIVIHRIVSFFVFHLTLALI